MPSFTVISRELCWFTPDTIPAH